MYYESKFGRVYFESHGPEGAPPILFSHGVNMNHETFRGQVEGLKDRFRIILWDLPFHGKSGAIDTKLPFSETTAELAWDLLQHLGIQKAVLAGLSLGSYVSQRVVYKNPEGVLASIHIGGGPLYPPSTPLLKAFIPFIGAFISLYPQRSIFKAFARHKALKPETQEYMERIAAENGKWVMAHLTRELLRDMVRGLPHFTSEPKLLIHGDHEIAFVQKQMKRWEQETRDSRRVVVTNAHHITNQDNPEEVNEAIGNFLEEYLVP